MGMKQRYFLPDRLSSEFDLVHSVVEWQDAKHIFTSDLKIIYHYSNMYVYICSKSHPDRQEPIYHSHCYC